MVDEVDARQKLEGLVARYTDLATVAHQADGGYVEEQVRVDFLDPFLLLFGWDLRNEGNRPYSTREVLVEPVVTHHGTDESGRPDYTLRPDGTVALFVEAKRPAVDILSAPSPAVQLRKYGWSAGLGVSVLTNFRSLVVYDTRFEPRPTDGPEVARIPGMVFQWTEYIDRFEELWAVLSRPAVGSDEFLVQFGQEREYRGQDSFDQRFLERVRGWRLRVAAGLAAANPGLSAGEVGRRTQQVLNSLVFLRVCEDRSLVQYADLRASATQGRLIDLFAQSDRRFNAGLFRALDGLTLPTNLVESVVEELYYPNSPYAFSVLDPAVLASIYEQFLGERVVVGGDRSVALVQKPEVLHSGGVAPTPDFLVRELLTSTVDGAPDSVDLEVAPPVVCDPACGSGPFLLAAYRSLLRHVEAVEGTGFSIGLPRKRDLLKRAIYGVDIDDQAVEVARLSLLLALLDGETTHSMAAENAPLLPDLTHNIQSGNSLVDPRFFGMFPEIVDDAQLLAETNVFDWTTAFPEVSARGGFDFVVGNPPWVRIQVLSSDFPDQLRFFQRPDSGFLSSQGNNFDLYMLFVERSLTLLAPGGVLGFVLPHRFMTSLAGRPLRSLLASGGFVQSIVHFGHEQLFPGRTNYVCLLVAQRSRQETFVFERVPDVDRWRGGEERNQSVEAGTSITADPWTFVADQPAEVFSRLRRDFPHTLESVADIFVGVQTSADSVFLLNPTTIGAYFVEVLSASGTLHRIERAVTRPALRDRRLEQYDQQPVPDAMAIFPYELAGEPAKAQLISSTRMQEEFPNAWAYLLGHRVALERRDLAGGPGDQWHRYGRSQSLARLDQPKVIVRVMSTVPRYAFDPDGLLVPGGGDGGPYYLIRGRADQSSEYHRYLMALLSHPVIDAMVVSSGRAFRGGYFVHRKAFLSGLPIPDPGESLGPIAASVEAVSTTVVALRVEADVTRRRALETLLTTQKNRVQELVSEVYALTTDELGAFDL
ncbi:MAG TPA: DNA methyltransferase [Candidatus Limnocylindrales bacterium]